MSVYTSLDRELCCPLCGETNTHVDQAQVAARKIEDGPITEIELTGSGDLSDATGIVPAGDRVGVGRRHRIALLGWCETCTGTFALVFTQHKGVTVVESVDLGADEESAMEDLMRQLGVERKPA